MKTQFLFPVFIILSFSCSNNSVEKGANETSTKPTEETTTKVTSDNSSQGDGITGYWKLALEAYDDNHNSKLDEEERKKGISNRYSFRFKPDKSCEIMDLYTGHYDVENKNGKQMLSVYRNKVEGEETKDPPPDIFEMTSMNSNELVLLETVGNHTFWVFNRK